MQHSRVQQVLREARAMVVTVRPQTPTVPPARLNALNTNTASLNGTIISGGQLPSLNGGAAGMGGSMSMAGASFSGRLDRLGSPSGTPPPEMQMLVSTDREAKGVVGRSTAVGQQWAQALLSPDTRVRHRAAANIFRHCEDELLDTALLTVTRTSPSINVQLLKSEGALVALLVAARHSYVFDTPTVAAPAGASSSSGASAAASPNTYDRLVRISMILAAAAETEGLQQYMVTSGAIQTVGEVLPKALSLLVGGSSDARDAVSSAEGSSRKVVKTIPPPPPLTAAALSPNTTASLLVAIANMLTALRVWCEGFPHHILKVGLVDALLRAFGAVKGFRGPNNGGAAAATTSATAVGNAAADNAALAGSIRPVSGAFASRYAFSSSAGCGYAPVIPTPPSSSAGPTSPGRPSINGSSSNSSSSVVNNATLAVHATGIMNAIVRIFCQLSFDDDCLDDLRVRKDNLLEPLLQYLAVVQPTKDPLLCARLMLLISRIIDGQDEACHDVVEYHWDTVVSKTFECLQKRAEIQKSARAYYESSSSAAAAIRPASSTKNGGGGGLTSPTSPLGPTTASGGDADDGGNGILTRSSSNISQTPATTTTSGGAAATAANASSALFIQTVTSDAVIAALALLSNVTTIEEGGYTLATSVPHMQCLMSLINADDTNEGGGCADGSDNATAKALAKDARTRTIRYTLVVLSNLSYYLPMMPMHDDDDEVNDTNDNDDDTTFGTRGTMVEALALSVCGFLFEGDTEATLEATRILGNLSRTVEGRMWMEENGADDALVLFLGHEDARLVYNCLGVLLNLTADEEGDPAVCRNPEAVSLLLQHTQRLVSGNSAWEIKEVVQMLLQNVQRSQLMRAGGDGEGANGDDDDGTTGSHRGDTPPADANAYDLEPL